jgi:hypothetical protein
MSGHSKNTGGNSKARRKGICLLAKWAKTKSLLPLTPPSIPNLVTPYGNATTPSEKAEALKAHFVPLMPDADLSDIPNASYPAEMPSPMSISKEEISSFIKKLHPFKVAGSDGIRFFVLKCLGSPLVSFLKPLFQACIDLSYHPTAFCHCNSVPLRKPGKGDYSVPRAWQPIAFFNTLGMVLESVITLWILSLSEEHSLLPAQHMGDRPSRSIDIAHDFLVELIHATWQNKDGMATLLSLDMTGAFDRVIPAPLLHKMKERNIPE